MCALSSSKVLNILQSSFLSNAFKHQTGLTKDYQTLYFCRQDQFPRKSRKLPDSPVSLYIILFNPQNQLYRTNVNFQFLIIELLLCEMLTMGEMGKVCKGTLSTLFANLHFFFYKSKISSKEKAKTKTQIL